nr:ubiquitin-like small modifier protein 1 [Salinirubellus salinus]
MELELRFFANFRAEVGQKTIHREYEDGSTVGDILLALEAEFPGLEGDLVEDGAVRDQLSVLKNGRDVYHMEGVDTPMEDGDRLSVFPPVAGGSEEAVAGGGSRTLEMPPGFSDAVLTIDEDGEGLVEKSYRGISERLALEYLVGMGGERVAAHVVAGEGWRVETSAEKVPVYEGSTMNLTEVTVRFTGEPDVLTDLLPRFAQKAIRAGG